MRLPSFIKLPAYKRYKYVPRYLPPKEALETEERPRISFKRRPPPRQQPMRFLLTLVLVGFFAAYFYWGNAALWLGVMGGIGLGLMRILRTLRGLKK